LRPSDLASQDVNDAIRGVARIAEAEREGWLGEIDGLRISLSGAEDKLAQVTRRESSKTDLGIPAIRTR
jgi:hypothetical protein